MKYILPIIFACILFLCSCVFTNAYAATASQSGTTNITVTVAGYQLNVSGFIAPFASISLVINDTVITSTTADKNGNFSFTNVAVPKSTTTICFDAVDFKKLGESEACVTVTPVNGVITKTGIYLPPTLGIQREEVFVGNSAQAFGYGMPGSIVTVHLSSTIAACTVTADSTGYYQCSFVISKEGSYQLYADATLNNKPSEAQLKRVLLKGLAATKVVSITPLPGFNPGFNLFPLPWWVWLLLVLIGLILLIILLRKYRPDLIPGVGIPAAKFEHYFDFLFKQKKLHHHWMKGVGY